MIRFLLATNHRNHKHEGGRGTNRKEGSRYRL